MMSLDGGGDKADRRPSSEKKKEEKIEFYQKNVSRRVRPIDREFKVHNRFGG